MPEPKPNYPNMYQGTGGGKVPLPKPDPRDATEKMRDAGYGDKNMPYNPKVYK